jgi:hypothetical protein
MMWPPKYLAVFKETLSHEIAKQNRFPRITLAPGQNVRRRVEHVESQWRRFLDNMADRERYVNETPLPIAFTELLLWVVTLRRYYRRVLRHIYLTWSEIEHF